MVTGLKQAFVDGAQDALAHYGLAPKKEKSTLRKALPWLAAAGAGAGAYKFLRTPSFSSNPALRKIQEQASSKGFHRVVDVTPNGVGGQLRPVADAEGKMSLMNKLKLFLNEGTTEAIPFTRTPKGPQLIGADKRNVEGVVYGRHVTRGTHRLVQGGSDIEGSAATRAHQSRLSRGGKRHEADFFQQHAPGAMPESFTDLRDHFADLPADRTQAAQALQERLRKAHGDNILMKLDKGVASSGKFPRMTDDWGKHVSDYDAHMLDPKTRQMVEELGTNARAEYLINKNLHQGHVLNSALKDPTSVFAQRLVDNPLGEYRVHMVAGKAPRQLTVPRGIDGSRIKHTREFFGGHDDVRNFAEAQAQKLPPEHRDGGFALDVMRHRNADGSIGHKIIESNPDRSVRRLDSGAYQSGGQSGFLIPEGTPFTGNLHYRAATGRHTPLVAGLGALGAASAVGGGTKLLTDDE